MKQSDARIFFLLPFTPSQEPGLISEDGIPPKKTEVRASALRLSSQVALKPTPFDAESEFGMAGFDPGGSERTRAKKTYLAPFPISIERDLTTRFRNSW